MYPNRALNLARLGLASLVVAVAMTLLGGSTSVDAQDRPFIRGDSNLDGSRDLSDGVLLLIFLFNSGATPGCEDAADMNDSGTLDISDASFLFNYLFLGGATIPAPRTECGEDPTDDALTCVDSTCEDEPDPDLLPGAYEQFRDKVEVSQEGNTMVIRSDGQPDHPSAYYPTNHPLWEAAPAGVRLNPNRIQAQDFVFRIPASPQVARRPTDTRLGPIGVAVNGVPLFNQYARPNEPLDREIISFDQGKGHPQRTGMYHYHVEPPYLTAESSSALIGYLLDGFPLYGPTEEDGSTPTDLDECNGHTHPTKDYPEGIYHYHVVPAPPYFVGCYKGTPGNFTN